MAAADQCAVVVRRVLPESIRWLASKGRTTEALNIVRRAAHLNRIPVEQLNVDEIKLATIGEVRTHRGQNRSHWTQGMQF